MPFSCFGVVLLEQPVALGDVPAAAIRSVGPLANSIFYVDQPIRVCVGWIADASVLFSDRVDDVGSDGVNNHAIREVRSGEAFPFPVRKWIGNSSIGHCHDLTDFVTNGTLGVGRLQGRCAVSNCRTLGVPNHDDLAGAAVAARDCGNAVDGVGEWLLVASEGDVAHPDDADRAVLKFRCHDRVRDAIDPGGEVRALVEIAPLTLVLAVDAMNKDNRVALAEGVVHTFFKATLVLGQSDVWRDAIAGVELVGDADDVCS